MMFKKGDFFVFAAVILLAAVLFVVPFFEKTGKTAKVYCDNVLVAELPLDTDTVYSLPHNTVKIENGNVFVSDADCKDGICVKTGKKHRSGENIICLPNKVVIEVE